MPNSPTQPPVIIPLRAFNLGTGTVTSTTQGNATAGASTTLFYVSILVPGQVSLTGVKVLLGTGGNGNIIASLHSLDGTLLTQSASTATGTTATTQSLPFTNGAYLANGPSHYLVGFVLSSASDSIRTISAVFDAGSNPMAGSVTVVANTPATFTPSATNFTANTGAFCSFY
jgi:hypothetical protein